MVVRLGLGYFKQGDDMAEHLNKLKDPIAALKAHKEQMTSVAEHLERITSEIEKSGEKVEIHADTHYISLECSKKLAKLLLEKELVEKD